MTTNIHHSFIHGQCAPVVSRAFTLVGMGLLVMLLSTLLISVASNARSVQGLETMPVNQPLDAAAMASARSRLIFSLEHQPVQTGSLTLSPECSPFASLITCRADDHAAFQSFFVPRPL